MAPSKLNVCPDPVTLQQFLLGQISGPEVEHLEEHVAGCSRCVKSAHTLATEDALVQAMRESAGTAASPHQEMIEAVLPLLKRLQRRDETLPPRDEPQRGDTLDHGGTQELFDFLAPPQADDELGRLGRYRVLRPLGAGGMGVVFLADDPRLKRQVALKVIRPRLVARADLRERFLREAQNAAQVEHDNIVIIHSVEEAEDVPFLVMPLLHGETLEARLRHSDGPLPVDEILHLGRQTAEGLAAAHARGLVHRDIKPANIWLEDQTTGNTGSTGNTGKETRQTEEAALSSSVLPVSPVVQSRVKILDFGLAQAVQGEQLQQGLECTIQGTPAFMAPEQARGQPGDTRADLFSLGCVLYRMATGRAPFQGADLIAVLMSVATEEPPPPQTLNPELPAELADLIVQLLAKRPEDRPASATACAERLRAIEKRAEAAHSRAVRRRWLLVTAAAVLAAVGLTVWLLPPGEGPAPELPPPPPPGEVTFDVDDPDQRLVVQRGGDEEQALAVKSSRVHSLPPGDYTVRAAVEKKGRQVWPDHFHVEPGAAITVPLRLVGEIRRGHPGLVWSVALSPKKGSLLALAAGSDDRKLQVWDAATEKDVQPLGGDQDQHKGPVFCVAISTDGRFALSGTGRAPRSDYAVRLWDLTDAAAVASFLGHQNSVKVVAFAPDGKRFLSGGDDRLALLWDIPTHKIAFSLEGHKDAVWGAAFSPDGRQVLTCSRDKRLILWDAATGRLLKRLEEHKDAVRGVAFAPDGSAAVSASWDGSLRVWDLMSARSREIRGHDGKVNAVAYAPDGKRLLSGGADKMVRLWDAATEEQVYCFQGHTGEVHGVAFASDGRRAVSGGSDGTLRLWELPR